MLAWATLLLALAVVGFAFFHTGARADGLCNDRVFVPTGRFALGHLGVRCEYGDASRVTYEHGASFYVLIAVLLMWLAALARRAWQRVRGNRARRAL